MLKKITVAVMCYGLYGYDYRSSEEMDGLRDYLNNCAEYINRLKKEDKLSGIIICGGFTNKDYPEVSEAQTTFNYLNGYMKTFYGYNIDTKEVSCRIEEKSTNTAQNISSAISMIYEISLCDPHIIPPLSNNIVFVCDRYRYLKVCIMAKELQRLSENFEFTYKIKSFFRKDPHPNSNWIPQLILASHYLINRKRILKESSWD